MHVKEKSLLMCVFLLLLTTFPVLAQTKFNEITAPEVKVMLEEGKGVVVHVLSEIEYDIQHIPGSINIPITRVKDTDRLPADKDAPIVFYGMGTR